MNDTTTEQAVNAIVAFVASGQQKWTTIETIDSALEVMLPAFRALNPDLDENLVSRIVRTRINVVVEEATVLEDNTDHQPWLSEARENTWPFWERYKLWLEMKSGFSPNVINNLDEITDDILGRLESPGRHGQWDRRGLVVGQVQSGKTSNYTGLICKAADAGYKIIVVMAGIHNSLRAQTQQRIDEAVIGIDSVTKKRCGVQILKTASNPIAHSLTDSSEKGDFKLASAQTATYQLGGEPLILVVKKNASVLGNLLQWVTSINATERPGDNRFLIRDIPLLLIDDEADNASINTKKDEADPTKINELIRRIMFNFEKAAYVGYTATPFANLYVDNDSNIEELGPDLFPQHFIIGLKPPSNYIGPRQVFGTGDADENSVEYTGLPMTRTVDDNGDWIPDKHKRTYYPSQDLPDTLKTAIRCFLLGCAGRNVRGHYTAHKSMLVHVTRFVDVQHRVFEQIRDELFGLRNLIKGGDRETLDELEALWEADFVSVTDQITVVHKPFREEEHAPITFEQISTELRSAVSKVEVREINGTARDSLSYVEHDEKGLTVIAVGGDKLSRGLTLEGLMVSYYLRATRMYDTLMQMGRWFGYRPAYLDFCRLYMTDDLNDWYREIVAASDELMQEFSYMADANMTPMEYGLRVRSHPGVLMVTAATKMRNGTKMSLSFAGTVIESIVFWRSEKRRIRQYEATESFLNQLENSESSKGLHQWREVSFELVTAWLRSIRAHPNARRAVPQYLADYIEMCAKQNELREWTISLFSSSADDSPTEFAGISNIGKIYRRDEADNDRDTYRIKRLFDPKHEALDLLGPELILARSGLTDSEDPSGLKVRHVRPPTRGHIILYLIKAASGDPGSTPYIGFGFSFPGNSNARQIEYVVNNVYLQEEIDFD